MTKIPITISKTIDVEVDVCERIYVSAEDIREAVQEDPELLNKLGIPDINKFKNLTLLDTMKLEVVEEILEKTTLQELEKFKQSL